MQCKQLHESIRNVQQKMGNYQESPTHGNGRRNKQAMKLQNPVGVLDDRWNYYSSNEM